ncbi:MAG: tetratricopeptide repeat protein, partial [Acidobacteria bacterium]|nr:tetratricopeptide repeat protein [Acidobacteriota bacterium]
MSRGPRTGRWLWVIALAAGLLGACERSREGAPTPEADAWPELAAVPHPDLSSVEEGPRRSLEGRRRELQDLRSKRETPPEQLARAFGSMGDLYQAYELPVAAEACYENARSLQPKESRWAYAHGLLQASSGRPEEAAASFEEASRLAPDDAAARIHRGEALLSVGRADDALEEFEAAGAVQAFEAVALYGQGRALAALGRDEEAVESYERTRELAPKAGVLRYPLARSLQKLGRGEEARAVLAGSSSGAVPFPDPVAEEIRDLAVGSAALAARGGEALMAGDLKISESFYRKAVTADPANIEARRNLAVVLLRAGRPGEAAETLEAARRLAPDNALVAFDLANARLSNGDAEGAISGFERALALSPDLEAAHFNLANVEMQLQRWGEAEAHLRRTLELSPENLQASYLLAMARYQQGHADEGLDGLKQVLATDPAMTAARMSLASIFARSGRLEEARQQYVALIGQQGVPDAERADAYTQLAGLSLRRRATAEAESQLEKALELKPGDESASATLVELLNRQGRTREARQVLDTWVTAAPGSAAAQLALAQTRIAGGELAAAKQGLEETLERIPGDPSLTHALARLLATAPEGALRDGARALVLAQQAYLAERSLERAETIAMAMAESGDFTSAVRWQQGLLEQARKM